MNANELRIGNLVDYHGQIIEVHGIDDIDVFNQDIGEIPLSQIKPIALSEDWMLEFEFTRIQFRPESWISYQKGEIRIMDDFRWNSIGTGVDIKFVHKLQNFYFAHTGKELLASKEFIDKINGKL